MPIIIVLDTNVLVAGLLSPFGPCGQIVRLVVAGGVKLCLDGRILAEYREVLARPKFGFDQANVAAVIDQIARCSLAVAPEPLVRSLPDPDDEAFLEVAIAGKARFLVTGNTAHFPADRCRPVKVVTPADFLARYRRYLARS